MIGRKMQTCFYIMVAGKNTCLTHSPARKLWAEGCVFPSLANSYAEAIHFDEVEFGDRASKEIIKIK